MLLEQNGRTKNSCDYGIENGEGELGLQGQKSTKKIGERFDVKNSYQHYIFFSYLMPLILLFCKTLLTMRGTNVMVMYVYILELSLNSLKSYCEVI